MIEASQGDKHSRTPTKCAAGKSVSVVIDFVTGPAAVAAAPDPVVPARRPSSSPRTALAIGAGALAVVSAGVGLGFLTSSNSTVSDAQSLDSISGGACSARPSCDDYRAQLDDARSARTVATIGLVSAGVFAAAAVAIYSLWPTQRASASTRPWTLRF
jgi:hypothetical protein